LCLPIYHPKVLFEYIFEGKIKLVKLILHKFQNELFLFVNNKTKKMSKYLNLNIE